MAAVDIDGITDFVIKANQELEQKIGILYKNGKLKEIEEKQIEKLTKLLLKLDEMKTNVERFTEAFSPVCGLEPAELRGAKGRHRTQADSAYTSATKSQLFEMTKPSNDRLSKADRSDPRISIAEERDDEEHNIHKAEVRGNKTEAIKGDAQENDIDEEKAECFNPSSSSSDDEEGLSESKQESKVSFNLDSASPSSASLVSSNDSDVPPTYDEDTKANAVGECSTAEPVEQSEVKSLNRLSKPPSEEDNTKQRKD